MIRSRNRNRRKGYRRSSRKRMTSKGGAIGVERGSRQRGMG